MKFAHSPDGTRIGYSSSGTGPDMLVVHGTATDQRRWQPVLPQLAARFTVHTMDRRGRGASGDGANYRMSEEFNDVAAVLAAVGPSVTLVAHSFGAICALEASRLVPNIKRLVLYEPPISTGDGASAALNADQSIQDLVDAGDDEAALIAFFQNVTHMPPAELAMLRAHPGWKDRVPLARTIPREMRAARDYRFLPERFLDYEIPTLLLLGGNSPPLFSSAIELLSVNLPGTTLAILPGQQHQAINSAPMIFLDAVMSFVGD